MANWSVDHHFFGSLYNQARADEKVNTYQEKLRRTFQDDRQSVARPTLANFNYTTLQQEVLANLRFDFERQRMGTAYTVNSIAPTGPAVAVIGSGRWGSLLPLSDESRAWMEKHVIVSSKLNDETESRSIIIGGELVYEAQVQVCHWKPREMGLPWKFEGRTPEERHFFAELFFQSFFRKWSKMEILKYAILNPEKIAEMQYYDNLYPLYDGDS